MSLRTRRFGVRLSWTKIDLTSSTSTPLWQLAGQLSIVARQTGLMMEHYLGGSGEDYRLHPRIFTENRKVQKMAATLRERASRTPCSSPKRFSSGTFYMPDPSDIDSVFGLYHGTLQLTQRAETSGACVRHFRAEVPWTWPSYSSLKAKYGDPHAESFT
jgi:hypothetical protein